MNGRDLQFDNLGQCHLIIEEQKGEESQFRVILFVLLPGLGFFNYNDGKFETTEERKEGREFTVGSVIHDWEQEESAMTDEAKLRLCILNGPLAFLLESECKWKK